MVTVAMAKAEGDIYYVQVVICAGLASVSILVPMVRKALMSEAFLSPTPWFHVRKMSPIILIAHLSWTMYDFRACFKSGKE